MEEYELYHSRKGTVWKKHKYYSKKKVNGKIKYLYGNESEDNSDDNTSDFIDGVSRDINNLNKALERAEKWLNNTKAAKKFDRTMEQISDRLTNSKVGQFLVKLQDIKIKK